MVWKYVAGDQYSVEQLNKFASFFLDDYSRAMKEVEKIKRFAKYGIPGYRWMLLHATVGVEEAKKNMDICQEALAVAKRENRYDNS